MGLDLAAVLRRTSLFRGLSQPLLERIVRASRGLRLERGQQVFARGSEARSFYAVASGSVRIYRATLDGRVQVVHNSRPGQTFAEAAALALGRYPVQAEARATPTELVAVDAASFRGLLAAEPEAGAAIVASLSQRLALLVDRVEELSAGGAEARLARFLLRLPARPEGSAWRLDLPGAKKEVAGELGLAPETLSRLLRRWRESGLVKVEGPRLWILDADALEQVAGGESGRA